MKTRLTIAITIMLSIVIMGFNHNLLVQNHEYETEAIFTGITPEDQFEFLDDLDEYIYFDSIKSDIKVNLYDEESIDKGYLINWVEEEIKLVDKSKESTGELRIYKIITKLKEL